MCRGDDTVGVAWPTSGLGCVVEDGSRTSGRETQGRGPAMAEGVRTEDGKRIWVVKREDDVEGQGFKSKFLRPAGEEDVESQGLKGKGFIRAEDEDDTIGHPRSRGMYPEPLDAEQGLYLAVVDSDEDVTGQAIRVRGLESDDTEGQGRGRSVQEDDTEGQGRGRSVGEDDAEGQVYRRRGPGGEDGKGSV
jgi:hypothetical protein